MDNKEGVEVRERTLWNQGNVIWAISLGFIIILIEFLLVKLFNLELIPAISIGVVMIFIYAIILFFLLEPAILREIKTREVVTIEKPVIKEIPRYVVHTVEKPIEKYVDRPVEKYVDRPVPVYAGSPKRKLNIPKYDYIASTESKTYHKKSCRLGKLIKKKYKLSSNNVSDFKRKKFKACKVCVLKRKKI